MRLVGRKTGFTLVEILVVIAAIGIFVSISIGLGKYLKDQGKAMLTESTISILVTAVEQFYDEENDMPFETLNLMSDNFSQSSMTSKLGGTVTFHATGNNHTDPAAYGINGNHHDWSSEAMYFCLYQNFSSRRLLNTIANEFITSRDSAGRVLMVDVASSDGTVIRSEFALPRIVDGWGNPIRFRYNYGDAFCVIASPGKDKMYGTSDDINNLK